MARFYGPHGTSKELLASGAPVPDGDFVELDKKQVEDPHNARLIAEGKLLPADEKKKEGDRR